MYICITIHHSELRVKNNSEQFEASNVTFVLEWIQEFHFVTYNIKVVPPEPVTLSTILVGNTSAQLTLPYNTFFNVNIIPSICNQTLSSASISLTYSKIIQCYLWLALCTGNYDNIIIIIMIANNIFPLYIYSYRSNARSKP